MWQPILMISGYFITIFGLAMLFPAAVDIYYSHQDWSPFITSSIISVFIGVSLLLGNKTKIEKLTIQQSYLLTAISWFSATLLSAVPFILSGTLDNWVDAIFESASGISTTGATVITNLDNTSKAVLLWRSLCCGLGGIGIVIFAVALLPFLGIGGMQIFQRENSDFNDKLLPKISYIAKRIILVYITLVALSFISLHFAGMSWFDAVNHALCAVSTGGLSTKDASIGYFDSVSIEIVTIISMIAGALPLTYYLVLLQSKDSHSFRTQQVPFFLKTLCIYVLGTALWLIYTGKYDITQAFRYASFNVVSVTTNTGFSSTDYMLWGNFAQTIFIIFALTGGCTGSTSGAVKTFRWQVILAYLKKSFITATEPSRIMPVKIGDLTVDNRVISSVVIFISAFMFSIVILTVLIALTGEDLTVAFSAVIGCITNAGPGVGSQIGPAGNYAFLSDFAKMVCAFAMLLGRLEILTIVVIFTRNFWRR